MKIIKTSEALPKSGRYVLAWMEGAKIPMRAMWADQHTLPLGDDADPEWGEYSEEKDEYFCPAGWYEMNQHEEQHWGVDGNVVAWCELPRLDHQCLAQIEEPAQPVAEICSASHDDAQFGERAIKPLCDISGFEYGTPLYAGAAPAAVAPEHPPMPETWAVVASIEGQDVVCISSNALSGKGELTESEEQAVIGMAQHLLAFVGYGLPPCDFDADDEPAPAPALEAPAAPVVPLKATPEMRAAFRLAYRRGAYRERGLWGNRMDYALDQMLAAAPQAPAVDLRPHLAWALKRISTSLGEGEHFAAAQQALDAAQQNTLE